MTIGAANEKNEFHWFDTFVLYSEYSADATQSKNIFFAHYIQEQDSSELTEMVHSDQFSPNEQQHRQLINFYVNPSCNTHALDHLEDVRRMYISKHSGRWMNRIETDDFIFFEWILRKFWFLVRSRILWWNTSIRKRIIASGLRCFVTESEFIAYTPFLNMDSRLRTHGTIVPTSVFPWENDDQDHLRMEIYWSTRS